MEGLEAFIGIFILLLILVIIQAYESYVSSSVASSLRLVNFLA
jgi:hypothetical protein